MSGGAEPRAAMLANIDLSGVLRGRAFPVERMAEVQERGLPWVPANILLSPLNTIPAPNPFGPLGETRLRRGAERPMILPARGDRPAMALHLADILTTEDEPWPVCPRGQLRRALAELEAEHGLTLRVGFEHELYLPGLQETPTPAFSLGGARAASGLAEEVQAMLGTAGHRLDQFVAEFGEHQFEIAAPPLGALDAADLAVLAREAIRDAARARGVHATFAPKPFAEAPGSGVHVHMSLWRDGAPVTARGGAPTAEAGAFVAGLLTRLSSVMGFTFASVNSYDRLRPSSWVGAFGCFGTRNREAAIRLCPRGPGPGSVNPDATFEFRLADGSASPHLALAALVWAGMAGLRDELPEPADVQADPGGLTAQERAAQGIADLPASLAEGLAALEASGDARAWFGPLMEDALLSVRRNDLADAERAGEAHRALFRRAV